MFGIYALCWLAQEEYRERTRRAEWQVIEGSVVWTPTLLGRIALTLREILADAIHKARQIAMPLAPSSVTNK